jgi:hypothetical protein
MKMMTLEEMKKRLETITDGTKEIKRLAGVIKIDFDKVRENDRVEVALGGLRALLLKLCDKVDDFSDILKDGFFTTPASDAPKVETSKIETPKVEEVKADDVKVDVKKDENSDGQGFVADMTEVVETAKKVIEEATRDQ